MERHEPIESEYLVEAGAGAEPRARALAQRFGWRLLGSTLGRSVALSVCRAMSRHLEIARGTPVVESQNAVVRLWRVDLFGEISWSPERPWLLQDGTILKPQDPVLEFHIAGDRFLELLSTMHWRQAIRCEFESMVPELEVRDEVALVGSTILRRQVKEFGATLRELPAGLHTWLDTFYRKLILLAFHPGGVNRVLQEREAVAEAAISREDFCRKYGGNITNAGP